MSGDTGFGLKMLEGVASGTRVLDAYGQARAARSQSFYDAALADAEAADARNRGATEAAAAEARAQRGVGRVKTQVAGRGFTRKGTAAALTDATDFMGQLDALTIRENARREMLGHSLRSDNLRRRGRSIRPGVEAFGTFIGESALVANRWRQRAEEE